MNAPNDDYSQLVNLSRFYQRVNMVISDLDIDIDKGMTTMSGLRSRLPLETLYGSISKEDFQSLIDAYDQSQKSERTIEQPVKCQNLKEPSYASLLWSKKGFHHIGSTNILLNDLAIKDTYRNTLLNQLSSFSPPHGEDIDSLRENQKTKTFKLLIKDAHLAMDKNDKQLADAKIRAVIDKNADNVDAMMARARMFTIENDFSGAIELLTLAHQIDKGSQEVKEALYLAHFTYGSRIMHSGDSKTASEHFDKALTYKPCDQAAIIHRGVCERRMRESTPFMPQAFRRRR